MVAGTSIPQSALERLVDEGGGVVFALDGLGRILHLGPAFSRLTGLPVEPWLGRHWLALVPEAERQRARRSARAAAAPGAAPRRARVRIAAGGSVDVHVHVLPRDRDPGGAAVVGLACEAGAAAALASRLRASETRFERVFHASPVPATIQRLADGRYLWANDAYLRVCGYRREELLGHAPEELGLWADPQDRREAVARLLERGSLEDLHACLRTRAGEVRSMLCSWVAIDFDGERCIFNVNVDVTDREQAEAELRALPTRLLEAQENERRRIARELHDEVGQKLSALRMLLMRLPAGDSVPASDVAEALDTVAGLIDQVRTLSLDLHARVLEEIGLEAALRSYADRQVTRAGMRLHLRSRLGEAAVPAEVAAACFRIGQEAVTNAVRHAGAGSVWMSLARSQGSLELSVEDDGRGIEPDARGTGLGLRSMHERAVLLGGRVEVGPRKGGGTRVVARLPLRRAA